jgi:prepilin-type N-terminal cleavage/methylation domain-containing protein
VIKTRSGFSLLELVVVITILGIVAVAVTPLFRGRESQLRTKDFVAKLNLLMQTSWQQALTSGKVQRVQCYLKDKKIELEEQKEVGSKDFAPFAHEFLTTQLEIPQTYYFKNFYIKGVDEMRKGKRVSVHFYITPSGLAQNVIINIIDQNDDLEKDESEQFGLVLNPFSAQFEYYDTFQKP